jgi:hypothetical protein
MNLICHPAAPPSGVSAITTRVSVGDHWLHLRWRIEGAGGLVVPAFAGRGRADGLWRTTCFELFVRGEGETYAEFNLSPSERWAAYDLTGYRSGMTDRPMPRDPVCGLRGHGDLMIFDADLPLAALPPPPWRYGLCAVIEEAGGVMSYWALAHGADRPDFHDRACFAGTLAAPPAP